MKVVLLLIVTLVCVLVSSQPKAGKAGRKVQRDTIGNVTAVKFNDAGSKLLVGYDYSRVELWDLGKDTNTLKWSNQLWQLPISSLNFVENINQVMLVNQGGGILFFDADKGSLSKAFAVDFKRYVANRPERIRASDYDNKRNVLAVAGNVADRVLLIDVVKLYQSQMQLKDTVYIVSSDEWERAFPYPKESSLVVAQRTNDKRDKSILKDLLSNIESFADDKEIITCVKIDPAFKYVLAGTKAGKLIKWSLKDSTREVFANKILPVVPSRDQSDFKDILGIDCIDTLAVSVCFYSSTCGQMQFWDSRDLSLTTYKKDADPSTCRNIKFSSDAQCAITTGDFYYRLWKLRGNAYVLQQDFVYQESVGYSKKLACVDFSTDGRIALGDQRNVFFFGKGNFHYLNNLRRTTDTLQIWLR